MVTPALLGLAALVAGTAAPAPSPLAPAGGGFDVQAYEVTVEPDLARNEISGRTLIRFRSDRDGLRDLGFSANALTLDRVRVDGRAARWTQGGTLVVSLPRALARGEIATLEVAYHGVPAHGLSFAGGGVYASYSTCDWMVCDLNRTGDKAALTLRVVVSRGTAVLASGRRMSRRSLNGGREEQVWREDRPYSPYLFGFAAGAMTTTTLIRQGRRFQVTALGGAGPVPAGLPDETAAMAAFFEAKAGVPLPHGAYVQLIVPGDEAQEASSFSILGADEMADLIADPREDWAVAHELAHQWWGNLITCRDWRELWLTEGFAVFMTAVWKEHRWGRAAYDHEMDLARKRWDRAKAINLDLPLSTAGDYPVLGVRRAIAYSKGALFLDHLRSRLGEAAFWRGVRAYTRAHVGEAVVSRDLQRALEQASGVDLSGEFQGWVYGAGR